jgi:outer membrane protein OmpA-like peptidoglycan-associated protein
LQTIGRKLQSSRMKTNALVLSLALLLSACASGPKMMSSPLPGAGAPAKPSPLASEEKWLHDWFSGTPVEIGAQDDGAVRVAVPLKHSFDAGQAKVKPALGAVLDKVATSLRRQAGAKLEVAAPADGGATANERGASMRDYLVSKGVRANRITRAGAPTTAVELRLLPPVQPIERLEDLPPTGSGTSAKPRANR